MGGLEVQFKMPDWDAQPIWESTGTVGYTPDKKYAKVIKEAIAREVEEFASFMLTIRELKAQTPE